MKPDNKAEAKALDKALLRRVIGLFRPYRFEVIKTLLAVLVGVGLGLLPAFLTQRLIDDGLQKGDMSIVALYSVFTLISVLAAAGMTLLYGYWSVVMGQKIVTSLRGELFKHLQKMSLRFFTSTRTGEIQTRLLSDVAGVQNVVSNTITDQLSNIAIVISCLVSMFILDWRLTVLSLVMIPVFGVIGQKVGDFAKTVREGTQEQTSELNSTMQEMLGVSGILLTKTIGRSDVILTKFDDENQKLAGWQVKSSLVMYLFFGMIRLITQVAPAIVFWLAGYFLIVQGDKSITIGKLVAFTGLQTRMLFPLTGIMGAQVEILSSLALFKRIYEYLDMPLDVQDRPDAKPLKRESVQGRIEFRDVCFRYEESVDLAIKGATFTAEPGQLVALVGPSGAGKTTLTYMIPRLYDPESGTITLDGQDLREIKLQDLSEAVGAVTQETYLLHTTIRRNLQIAKPEASHEEIIAACKAAAIHDHIASLPEGYDTVVGERGYKLSGGEKQRLAIARAILKNPPILILDEATSALDTHSERLIQQSLATLMQGRTTFAIAHRLSTIIEADQILVVVDGQIVERGRHPELLAKGGVYADLYNEQFRAEQQTMQDALA